LSNRPSRLLGRRRIAMTRMATVLVLLASAILFSAQPSFAASCSGSGCAGKNPQTEGCSTGAVVKKEYSSDSLTLQIRYSSTCHAWWARATTEGVDPTCALYAAILQIQGGRQTSGQRLVGAHALSCEGGTSWTYMIADLASGDSYNACAKYGAWTVPQSPSESNGSICTGRF
jgi:hypothetical protein